MGGVALWADLTPDAIKPDGVAARWCVTAVVFFGPI